MLKLNLYLVFGEYNKTVKTIFGVKNNMLIGKIDLIIMGYYQHNSLIRQFAFTYYKYYNTCYGQVSIL